ncbi:hypothetical protein WAI453_001888 [Rhynchosporium graminicola]
MIVSSSKNGLSSLQNFYRSTLPLPSTALADPFPSPQPPQGSPWNQTKQSGEDCMLGCVKCLPRRNGARKVIRTLRLIDVVPSFPTVVSQSRSERGANKETNPVSLIPPKDLNAPDHRRSRRKTLRQ